MSARTRARSLLKHARRLGAEARTSARRRAQARTRPASAPAPESAKPPKSKRTRPIESLDPTDRRSRKAFFTQAAPFTPLLAVDSDELRFLLDTSDTSFGKRFFGTGQRHEFAILGRTLRVLEALGAPVAADSVFVEVGAHIGTTTLPALLRHGFASAVAFEPAPRNRRLLAANAALNGADARLRIVPAAVSDAPGSAQLVLHGGNSGAHRLLEDGTSKKGIDVPVTTVDVGLEEAGVDPAGVGLLWVDAQGSDIAVVRGARSLTARRCPFVVEIGGRDLAGERLGEFAAALAGYRGLVDLRAEAQRDAFGRGPKVFTAGDLDAFARMYDGAEGRREFTDVLAF